MNVGNLISGSSAFSKPGLYIWKFSVHVLLKPSLKDFVYNLNRMENERNCMVAWTLFDIGLLWDWNENWNFPVLWSLLSFPDLLAYWVKHINSIIFSDFKKLSLYSFTFASFVHSESESEVAQWCPTFWDPVGCSLPGSSVHGIFQAIVLEWIAISFSRWSSQPRDWTGVSCIVDRRFTVWASMLQL